MKLKVTLAVLLITSSAQATKYSTNCDGNPVRWGKQGFPHYPTISNGCSMPSGSTPHGAYRNAIDRINEVTSLITAEGETSASDCEIEHGDGQNDVALVAPSVLDGNPGRAQMGLDYDWCGWDDPISYAQQYIEEVDIMINAEKGFSNIPEDNADPFIQGRNVFLHEFLHGVGLEHEAPEVFTNMKENLPLPLTGGIGEHTKLTGDDAWGLRLIYPFEGVFRSGTAGLSARRPDGVTRSLDTCRGYTSPLLLAERSASASAGAQAATRSAFSTTSYQRLPCCPTSTPSSS